MLSGSGGVIYPYKFGVTHVTGVTMLYKSLYLLNILLIHRLGTLIFRRVTQLNGVTLLVREIGTDEVMPIHRKAECSPLPFCPMGAINHL